MARRTLRLRWRRKKPNLEAVSNHQALALIHMGRALNAYQGGDPLKAIRYLSLTVESIMQLIEEWSAGRVEIIEEEDEHGL